MRRMQWVAYIADGEVDGYLVMLAVLPEPVRGCCDEHGCSAVDVGADEH